MQKGLVERPYCYWWTDDMTGALLPVPLPAASIDQSLLKKSVHASLSKLQEHAKRLLDGGRECLRLALPFVATFFSPVEAVGAGKIVVTLDAMHTAPVASSGDLITFWLSRR